MAKRTSRVAWGIAAVVAVGLLGGVGLLLTRGVKLGHFEVVAYGLDGWQAGIFSSIWFREDDVPKQVDALCMGRFGVRLARPWNGSSSPARSGTGR